MGDHARGRWFWYDEVPRGRLGKWEMVVRIGVGLAGARRSGGGGEATLKQELVASSAGNNMHAVRSTYGKFPPGARLLVLLPVTKMFHDCPLAPCTLHLAPCTCLSHFVTSLPGTRHVDRKKARLDAASLGCGLAAYALEDAIVSNARLLPLSSPPSFLSIKPLPPKQRNKDENCPERETEQQAISSLQAGQASHPMQPEACCIDYVVDRPRYSMYVHHYRCITLDWGLSRIYPSHNALFSMDVFPLRGGMGVCLR